MSLSREFFLNGFLLLLYEFGVVSIALEYSDCTMVYGHGHEKCNVRNTWVYEKLISLTFFHQKPFFRTPEPRKHCDSHVTLLTRVHTVSTYVGISSVVDCNPSSVELLLFFARHHKTERYYWYCSASRSFIRSLQAHACTWFFFIFSLSFGEW